MKKNLLIGLITVVCLSLLIVEPALAGPGGKIAKAVFETFWGRIALGIISIIFLPLICYVILLERIAERRARKDLRFMAGYSPIFDWLKIQQRTKDCFFRVHSGWENEDLSGVSNWMTDWYWQNQQMVFLDDWKKKGLVNICKVKKIAHIKPLLFVHRNQGAEHEDSIVVISITANMQDYLQQRDTQKIIEGSKKYKEVETIWTFTLEQGIWKVSDIEEGGMSFSYARMVKELPACETTVISHFKA